MALNYTTLQTAVLAIAKRPSMTIEVVECIRRAEGMIRRALVGYELQATIDEDDRSDEGVYNAPAYALYVQHVFTSTSGRASYPVTRVGLGNIRRMRASAEVLDYAHYGAFMEFRGVPATDQEMEVHYIGHPAPLTDTATNALLTDHEEIYTAASLFQLYSGYTEDLELAQSQLDIFTNATESLNEVIRRKLGGGIQGPGYNLGNILPSGGY